MRTVNPLKGLLLYFVYSTGWRLAIIYLQAIVWGIAFLIFGHAILHILFGINAIAGAAVLVVTSMGNKEIDWERFQLSMPVRRRDLASSQYLSVGLAPLIGIPLFVVFTGLSSIWHEDIYFTLLTIFTTISPFLSMPFILGGFIFPLACIKFLEDKAEGFFPILLLASYAIPLLVNVAANHWGWSIIVASSLMLAISILIFIVSYFITRRLYAKLDF